MGPFWLQTILRHLIFRGTKMGPYFGNYPYRPKNLLQAVAIPIAACDMSLGFRVRVNIGKLRPQKV